MPESLTTPPVGRRRYPPPGGRCAAPAYPPARDLRGPSRDALGAMVRPRVLGAFTVSPSWRW